MCGNFLTLLSNSKLLKGLLVRSFIVFVFHLWQLSVWSKVLPEKLIGLQLVKKFPAFCGTRRFIIAFTRARHLSLSWDVPDDPMPEVSLAVSSDVTPYSFASNYQSIGEAYCFYLHGRRLACKRRQYVCNVWTPLQNCSSLYVWRRQPATHPLGSSCIPDHGVTSAVWCVEQHVSYGHNYELRIVSWGILRSCLRRGWVRTLQRSCQGETKRFVRTDSRHFRSVNHVRFYTVTHLSQISGFTKPNTNTTYYTDWRNYRRDGSDFRVIKTGLFVIFFTPLWFVLG